MTDEALGRVERAILLCLNNSQHLNNEMIAKRAATLAVQCMRQPTQAMVCAGDEQIISALYDRSIVCRDPTPAAAAWMAMIDEMLSQKATQKEIAA